MRSFIYWCEARGIRIFDSHMYLAIHLYFVSCFRRNGLYGRECINQLISDAVINMTTRGRATLTPGSPV